MYYEQIFDINSFPKINSSLSNMSVDHTFLKFVTNTQFYKNIGNKFSNQERFYS